MKLTLPCLAVAVTLLSACNIGGIPVGSSSPAPTPQRGQLVTNPPTATGTYGPSDIPALLAGNSTAAQLDRKSVV